MGVNHPRQQRPAGQLAGLGIQVAADGADRPLRLYGNLDTAPESLLGQGQVGLDDLRVVHLSFSNKTAPPNARGRRGRC